MPTESVNNRHEQQTEKKSKWKNLHVLLSLQGIQSQWMNGICSDEALSATENIQIRRLKVAIYKCHKY